MKVCKAAQHGFLQNPHLHPTTTWRQFLTPFNPSPPPSSQDSVHSSTSHFEGPDPCVVREIESDQETIANDTEEDQFEANIYLSESEWQQIQSLVQQAIVAGSLSFIAPNAPSISNGVATNPTSTPPPAKDTLPSQKPTPTPLRRMGAHYIIPTGGLALHRRKDASANPTGCGSGYC